MKNLKRKLSTGQAVLGLFLSAGSTAVTEVAAGCGYDFFVLDGEHGQCDERSIFEQMARLDKYEAAAIVRLPAFRPEYVKRMLDYGADGILVPMIENAGQAQEFAKSLRYPPRGRRGMTGIFRASDYNNNFAQYYREADDTLLAAVQIESAEAVENVEAIAAVDGVDLLFIGHSDLSIDYGCYKEFNDPRVVAAEKRVIAAAKANGKFVGMVLRPGMDLNQYVADGVNFICLGTDLGMMKTMFQKKLSECRDMAGNKESEKAK